MTLRLRPYSLAAAALLAGAALALPSAAESLGSAASSASSAGSASSGSISDSVRGSSNSSTRTTQAAEGTYRVLNVAAVDGRPGHVELHLRPEAASADTTVGADPSAQDLWLRLPRAALDARGLAGGDLVQVRQRPYGLAFAYADERRDAFYLALHEAWQRGLASHAL